jgi:hypothetical protein
VHVRSIESAVCVRFCNIIEMLKNRKSRLNPFRILVLQKLKMKSKFCFCVVFLVNSRNGELHFTKRNHTLLILEADSANSRIGLSCFWPSGVKRVSIFCHTIPTHPTPYVKLTHRVVHPKFTLPSYKTQGRKHPKERN